MDLDVSLVKSMLFNASQQWWTVDDYENTKT